MHAENSFCYETIKRKKKEMSVLETFYLFFKVLGLSVLCTELNATCEHFVFPSLMQLHFTYNVFSQCSYAVALGPWCQTYKWAHLGVITVPLLL